MATIYRIATTVWIV